MLLPVNQLLITLSYVAFGLLSLQRDVWGLDLHQGKLTSDGFLSGKHHPVENEKFSQAHA